MRQALIFISLKDWRNHKLRAVITLIGVAIGVSTYFAIRTVNQSLLHSLETTIDSLAGKATLQITAGESGFPEAVLETIRSTPGVTDATGVVQIFCVTALDGKPGLLIFGVDPDEDPKLRGYNFDELTLKRGNPLQALKVPGTIVVSLGFANQQHLSPGDSLPVLTPKGKYELTIVSAFKDDRISSLFGGRVGLMDIHSAQQVFGRNQIIDRGDVITDPGVAVETVQQRLRDRLARGLYIERPQTRNQQVEDATLMVRRGFLLTSLVALLISCFLIFNAMTMAVNRRWKEIGILRALGVERSNVRRMFLYEASLLGLIGSGVGLAAGYYLAVRLSKFTGSLTPAVSSTMSSIIAAPELPRFNTAFALESIVIGILATIVSAWLPAHAASQLDPIFALHNIEARQRESILGWKRMVFGATLLIIGLALIRFTTPQVGVMFQLVYLIFIFFGLVIMLPRISCWIASVLRPLAGRVLGPEAVLAIDSVIQAPSRTSITVGALMTSLAFVFSTYAFIQSQKQVVIQSLDHRINFDLMAWAAPSVTQDVATRIASIPGVTAVGRFIFTTTRYRNQAVGLSASDLGVWFSRPENTLIEGNREKARELLPKGDGVLISDVFAARWGVGVGDTLSLEAPSARLERPVLGIVEDKTWLGGVIYLDRSLYQRYWNDERIRWLSIDLAPNAVPAEVKIQVENVSSTGQLLFVETADETRNRGRHQVVREIDRLFMFFYVQMFIATFVAVMGITNTLVISVWERKREIGIIRAIGGTRRQITKMVLFEATVLAIVGLVTAVVKGVFDTYFMARTAANAFGGYSVPFYFPRTLILLSIPIVIAIALAAAWWPAKLASDASVVAALGSE
jgi:putative ABC transport system permease protein